MEDLLTQLKKDSKTEQFKLNVVSDIDSIKTEYIIPSYKALSIKLMDYYFKRLGYIPSEVYDSVGGYEYVNIAQRVFRPFMNNTYVNRKHIDTTQGNVNECISKIDLHNKKITDHIQYLQSSLQDHIEKGKTEKIEWYKKLIEENKQKLR